MFCMITIRLLLEPVQQGNRFTTSDLKNDDSIFMSRCDRKCLRFVFQGIALKYNSLPLYSIL